ncbi:MAG: ABC transporter permease [bacterium]|nr:ABC transporter permease [bacterium]
MHLLDRLRGPTINFIFGTDQYGRDIFSRVLVGGRTSLTLGLGAVLLQLLLGIPIGLVTGYFGGKTDEILMRLMDTLISIPSLLMALLILSALGGSMFNAMLAIGIVGAPRIGRVVRSSTLSVKNEEFVLAAKARGESHIFIMFGEILPNVLSPIIIEATIGVGFAIMIGASLSYLGLGVQPPQADWGLMIRQAREYLFSSPYPMVFPGLALAVTIIGFNLLGDGLRDFIGEKTE